jgi:hypothetical protein
VGLIGCQGCGALTLAEASIGRSALPPHPHHHHFRLETPRLIALLSDSQMERSLCQFEAPGSSGAGDRPGAADWTPMLRHHLLRLLSRHRHHCASAPWPTQSQHRAYSVLSAFHAAATKCNTCGSGKTALKGRLAPGMKTSQMWLPLRGDS